MSGDRSGRIVTMLILFLVVIVAVVLIFLYFEGYIGPSGNSSVFSFSGTFSISPGGGPKGAFAFALGDSSSSPITGFSFSCPPSSFDSSNCDGLFATYNNIPISPKNPLPSSATASATGSVTAATGMTFQAGELYSVTITATFADGAKATLVEQLSATP